MKPLLYIDLFCGAGGTSTGVETAMINGHKCAKVIACINHDKNAIASHLANHPEAIHYTEDIRTFNLTPLIELTKQKRTENPEALLVLWASLECTNFSKAKGGKPRDPDSRTLAEHLFRYVEALNPDYIQIENVEEFMAWGKLDEKGKPISKNKGITYLKWCNHMKKYGYTFSYRLLNAADFGAYTSRKRFFGQFAKRGLQHSFPTPTHCKDGLSSNNLFDMKLNKWKPVREVLDLADEGESIFMRRKPLCDRTLERIYAGLVKFVAGGKKQHEEFMLRYNSVRAQDTVRTFDEPCGTVTTENRLAKIKCQFLSKQFSGDANSKNQSIDKPAGTITTIDHHAFITAYYGNGQNHSINKPAPTIVTHNRLSLIQPRFIVNEYGNGNSGNGNTIDSVCPAITTHPKQKLCSLQYLVNPQYESQGGSINEPCFTLIARMDKMPPYLITTETGDTAIAIYESDSPIMRKIKEFMSIYQIIDIKMRMLKVPELKRIMGFPTNYVLIGNQAEQKKFIGNAVEVNMSKKLCEALSAVN